MQIGPVKSSGVLAWVAHARGVLAEMRAGRGPAGPALAPGVVDAFERFLDEWQRTAAHDDEFVWSADVDPEQVEFLAHAFYNIAQELATAAEARGYPLAPPEGEEFYQSLVCAFLDALEQEGKGAGAFAEDMRTTWPGLKEP